MVDKEDPTRLIAKYLLDHGYLNTLEALSHDAAIALDQLQLEDADAVSLESILAERSERLLSLQLANAKLNEMVLPVWSAETCPSQAYSLPGLGQANVLFVSGVKIDSALYILVTTADKLLRLYHADTFECQTWDGIHTSPILEARVIGNHSLLTAGMDGAVKLSDLRNSQSPPETLPGRHTRYVHRLLHNDAQTYLVSTGYDKQLILYKIASGNTPSSESFNLVASEQLATVVEGLCFVMLQGTEHLAITRRDSCMIEYLSLDTLQVVHTVNMNANKDLWVSFSGVDLAIQPVPPHLLGVATSKSPLGRWLAFKGHTVEPTPPDHIIADIYHGAAVSDLGVLPRFAWRPHGSGFFVGSDDGTIYGVSIKTGKVMKTLRNHSAAVRSLWCGFDAIGNEVLVSGSFDKTVSIWRV
ncbi:WD40-repeat-containing domain protein [Protomyces lactucae-debilis]|uniref:WD40-repeat-containing domain protein n=1 Tax=Protomyces lactucae-debilis TaxID=2754530 RepID=A0A1Y2F5D2_PROLT|nr:WD40-repeat-containing domain protein [Protomyces lactucae-debilis]ORY79071.1 WD40-repeat-containing domain protein [Protomyces lactucae-debilis]